MFLMIKIFLYINVYFIFLKKKNCKYIPSRLSEPQPRRASLDKLGNPSIKSRIPTTYHNGFAQFTQKDLKKKKKEEGTINKDL